MANEGILLEGWQNLRICDLGKIVTGKTPSTKVDDNFGSDVPFITPSDMDDRRVISKTARYLTQKGAETVASAKIPAGSIMVSCIGSDMGKVAIAGHDSVTNQQINSIIVLDPYPNLFVYYNLSLRKVEFQHLASGGSTLPILNKGNFSELPILMPPLKEQKAIAHILGTLDDKIELNRKMNETLEAMAQAIFKSWFVDFDPVRTKAEGRQPNGLEPEIAKLFPDAFQSSGIGEIPKGWRIGRIGDSCTVQGGFAYKSSDFTSFGHPVIKIKNITSNKDVDVCDVDYLPEDVAQETKDFWLKDGDLIMAMTGATVGKFGLIINPDGLPCVLNQRVCRFFSLPQHGEKVWFLYCALSKQEIIEQVISIADGSAQPNISASGICSAECLLPPDMLIRQFNQQVIAFFETILHNRKQSRTLTAISDALLPKLLSGEIRVKDAEKFVEKSTM